MLIDHGPEATTAAESRRQIRAAHRADEAALVADLAAYAEDPSGRARAKQRVIRLVEHVREQRREVGGIDALMQEYDLSSSEGVTLMCLAEALLRIPDAETTDHFIEDKLGGADWAKHFGQSDSFFVNASTFGLMMAGRTVGVDEQDAHTLAKVVKRLGEPVVRQAVRRAMVILGRQFVMGRTIDEAMSRAKEAEARGYRYSYDMLGEAARTMADADRYLSAYEMAIRAVGKTARRRGIIEGPSISVKLSALHPRYEFAQQRRVRLEVYERLLSVCEAAQYAGTALCIDAEEADRLELSFDLLEAIAKSPSLKNWDGLGLALQAYQKRAFAAVDWLAELAGRSRRRFLLRLVKGAYWDTEIKLAQEGGFSDYPVFTRKVNTDVSYLACAKRLLSHKKAFYPAFATHNANTLSAIVEYVGTWRDFEFQRLHGMGEALYDKVIEGDSGFACRVYAPVGGHEDLLAYLVRRLLENGANTSFVNRIADDALPIEAMTRDPVEAARSEGFSGHPKIVRPPELFADRANSAGLDLTAPDVIAKLKVEMDAADRRDWRAAPRVGGEWRFGQASPVYSPADPDRLLGEVVESTTEIAKEALHVAKAGSHPWAGREARERASLLRVVADRFEQEAPRLMTLIVREAGRSVRDAHLEIREAVDFLRYYAGQAEALLDQATCLPGPTGEDNTLTLSGRGPFLCIAPWNFPVAIFTGQIAAALAAGCTAIAKPAEQTPLCGAAVVDLMLDAGIPGQALQFLPGDGPTVGNALLREPALAGVAFTGSTETARIINQELSRRDGPIVPLIAETGGINAMVVDSTALPEQVTRDVLISAFQSAGQRCSALRLLCIQDDVADKQVEMIAGAMQELKVGDPALLETDVGPVIDGEAMNMLTTHRADMEARFRRIAQTPLPSDLSDGFFFAPVAFEIDRVSDLEKEVFGPVLHVVRFRAEDIEKTVEAINGLGFGLTFSIHSRSESRIRRIASLIDAGNLYVNRNQIGAVVGVQPFGGMGLSGTGPKAGGPHYLLRFLHEQTLTIDTTASGGNASLMTLEG